MTSCCQTLSGSTFPGYYAALGWQRVSLKVRVTGVLVQQICVHADVCGADVALYSAPYGDDPKLDRFADLKQVGA